MRKVDFLLLGSVCVAVGTLTSTAIINIFTHGLDEKLAILLAAAVGGIITAGVGVVLELLREKRKEENTRAVLTTAICDDLDHSEKIYDKLLQDWLEHRVVFFSNLKYLKESRQTYYNNKDWIHLFETAGLRREIFNYYLKSSDCINLLEFNQNRKYDFSNKVNQAKTQLKLRDSNLSDEFVDHAVMRAMPNEYAEYKQLDVFISDGMTALFELKSEAALLAIKLRARKQKAEN